MTTRRTPAKKAPTRAKAAPKPPKPHLRVAQVIVEPVAVAVPLGGLADAMSHLTHVKLTVMTAWDDGERGLRAGDSLQPMQFPIAELGDFAEWLMPQISDLELSTLAALAADEALSA